MKNIHVLPTDKPSRLCNVLCTEKSTLTLFEDEMEKGKRFFPENIYITSSEEIKDGNWILFSINGEIEIIKVTTIRNNAFETKEGFGYGLKRCKKIILTTDQELIKDGIQAIDDKFLEWFVKNPSCEEVEVTFGCLEVRQCMCDSNAKCLKPGYEIIIPKEKPKYPIGGYAPGNYTCTCVTCKTQFKGDKRAVQCEPCAISITKEEPKCEHPYRFREYYNENSFKCFECNKIIVGSNIEEPKQDLEKEMFELEQELNIPSHLRWHNSKPKLETIKEGGKINPLLMDEIGQFKFLPKQETTSEGFHRISKEFDYSEFDFVSFKIGTEWQQEQFSKSEFIQLVRATKSDAEVRRIIREYFK